MAGRPFRAASRSMVPHDPFQPFAEGRLGTLRLPPASRFGLLPVQSSTKRQGFFHPTRRSRNQTPVANLGSARPDGRGRPARNTPEAWDLRARHQRRSRDVWMDSRFRGNDESGRDARVPNGHADPRDPTSRKQSPVGGQILAVLSKISRMRYWPPKPFAESACTRREKTAEPTTEIRVPHVRRPLYIR